FEWRVRVVRLFRGTASGEITVWVNSHRDLPSLTQLTVGESYLFYTSLVPDLDGRPVRTTPLACSNWLPLNAVSSDEISFLANLSNRRNDGRILGVVVRPVSGIQWNPMPGVAIQLENGGNTYRTITDNKGQFEVGGLRPGTYHVNATLPPA